MRVAAVAASALAIVGSAATADPPLARPDYLMSLPDRQWVVAEKLWEERHPCTPILCEAGYHDGDLVLSVVRGLNYFQAVAGLKGCWTTTQKIVPSDNPASMTAEARFAIVSELATSVAKAARSACKGTGTPPDTAALRAL
ncbi:MAG: hypothetical protein JWO81_299 [Alphaproteobacteria bacterium]|nr:hypothetical protein [Alphaproteobacteria bacterium]